MNTVLLEAVRDVFDHLLEASGEGANVWPAGPAWMPKAKLLARELEVKLQALFQRQAEAYASRIPDAAGAVKEADPGEVAWIAEVLSDDVAWQKELGNLVLPYVTKGVQTGATETAAAFGIGIDFDLADKRVKKIILDRSIPFAKEVQQTTHDKVRKTLAKAADEGDSIYEMRERIKKLPDFDPYRAEMVARTEVLSAMNAGEMESYALMGAAGKRWKAAHDSRTREAHRRADGQVRGLDEPFRVGGEDLKHPGDGSAKNRINCRCTMAPVFDQETVDRERGEWSEEHGAEKWEATRKERDAIKNARLENQRKRQQKYLKQYGGKHAKSGADSGGGRGGSGPGKPPAGKHVAEIPKSIGKALGSSKQQAEKTLLKPAIEKHIREGHPKDVPYISRIEELLKDPDGVALSPRSKARDRVEFYKQLDDVWFTAVVQFKENYNDVVTFHRIDLSKALARFKSGRIVPYADLLKMLKGGKI